MTDTTNISIEQIFTGTKSTFEALTDDSKQLLLDDLALNHILVEERSEQDMNNLIAFVGTLNDEQMDFYTKKIFESDFDTTGKDEENYKWINTIAFIKNPVFETAIQRLKDSF
jgi:hypothetical protein